MEKLITRSGKLISRGGNLISKSDPPPPPAACWEGVMTVGELFNTFIGWSDNGNFGDITNRPPETCNGGTIVSIYWRSANGGEITVESQSGGIVNEIEINGQIYDMVGSPFIFNTGPNPFPPVGETCIIKILS